MEIQNKVNFFYGHLKKKTYFERWQLQLLDSTRSKTMVITMGIFLKNAERYAFISILSSLEGLTRTMKYPIETFSYTKDSIMIGSNTLSRDGIVLDVEAQDYKLQGKVIFSSGKQLGTKFWQSGLMGPLGLLPFLSSYHEVLTLTSEGMGEFWFGEKHLDFNEGKSAMSKSWGKRCPNIWMWMQCNHFEKEKESAIMVGVARMKVLWNYYTLFAVPIYFNEKTGLYASYTGAQIAKFYRFKNETHLVITEKNKVIDIKIQGTQEDLDRGGIMKIDGIKDQYESLGTKVTVKITQNGQLIFEDMGHHAHLKISGNTSKLK